MAGEWALKMLGQARKACKRHCYYTLRVAYEGTRLADGDGSPHFAAAATPEQQQQ